MPPARGTMRGGIAVIFISNIVATTFEGPQRFCYLSMHLIDDFADVVALAQFLSDYHDILVPPTATASNHSCF